MHNVEIKIGKATYSKTDPMISDWKRELEYIEQYGNKNFMVDEEAGLAVFKKVADYVGAPYEEMIEQVSLTDIMNAYRQLQDNIYEVFIGTPPQKTETKKAVEEAETAP